MSSQLWAIESKALDGCYYVEEKVEWLNQHMTLVTAILVKQQDNKLRLRAEFDHIHACRIYDHRTGDAIVMQKQQDTYHYHYKDDEMNIDCHLSLVPKDNGFTIMDHEFQCRELWECGARAGVGHHAKPSDKVSSSKPCEDYFAGKKPVVR